MCIAAVVSPHAYITQDQWANMVRLNPHGAGFSFVHPSTGQIKIVKSMDGKELFYKFERAINSGANDHPMLVHMRWATNGAKTTSNAHPFRIRNANASFVHNGIISQLADDANVSDSMLFGKRVLSRLPKNWHKEDSIKLLLEDYIGKGNKVAALFGGSEPTYTILNEELGNWVDGVWFSNNSHTGFRSSSARPSIKKKSKSANYLPKSSYRTPSFYERMGA